MDQFAQIEDSLRALWEKAKVAGETIVRLREEKQSLNEENAALKRELAKLRSELELRDQQMVKLSATAAETQSSGITNGEREQLSAKVKELLARIDAYL